MFDRDNRYYNNNEHLGPRIFPFLEQQIMEPNIRPQKVHSIFRYARPTGQVIFSVSIDFQVTYLAERVAVETFFEAGPTYRLGLNPSFS